MKAAAKAAPPKATSSPAAKSAAKPVAKPVAKPAVSAKVASAAKPGAAAVSKSASKATTPVAKKSTGTAAGKGAVVAFPTIVSKPATPPPEPKPPTPPPPPPPVPGSVIVRFNHYKESFPTLNGVLQAALIADRWSFSVAYAGNYKLHLTAISSNAKVAERSPGGQHLDTEFLDCVDQAEYRVEIEEDDVSEAAALAAAGPPRQIEIISMEAAAAAMHGGSAVAPKGKRGVDALTEELKKLSPEELREAGDKYKQLLEARDLEDILYS